MEDDLILLLCYSSLVTVKLIIGINLLSYANRRKHGMEERAKEDDDLNDGGPIGEGKDERVRTSSLAPSTFPN